MSINLELHIIINKLQTQLQVTLFSKSVWYYCIKNSLQCVIFAVMATHVQKSTHNNIHNILIFLIVYLIFCYVWFLFYFFQRNFMKMFLTDKWLIFDAVFKVDNIYIQQNPFNKLSLF